VVDFLVVVQICSFTPKAMDTSAFLLCNLYCKADLAGRVQLFEATYCQGFAVSVVS